MTDTHLEDAEALRLLWEDLCTLAEDARRLADLSGRLTHTVRRFAETYAAGEPEDPRALLQEVGAAVERCLAVELCRVGVQDALGALRFAFVPNPAPHFQIQRAEMEALNVRLAGRGHPVRTRPRPGRTPE